MVSKLLTIFNFDSKTIIYSFLDDCSSKKNRKLIASFPIVCDKGVYSEKNYRRVSENQRNLLWVLTWNDWNRGQLWGYLDLKPSYNFLGFFLFLCVCNIVYLQQYKNAKVKKVVSKYKYCTTAIFVVESLPITTSWRLNVVHNHPNWVEPKDIIK